MLILPHSSHHGKSLYTKDILLYRSIQSCMIILPIAFVVDLRKLVFLHKLILNMLIVLLILCFIVVFQEFEFYVKSSLLFRKIYAGLVLACV